jgi:hypothetical protein
MDKRQRACQIWTREEEDARAGRRRETGWLEVGAVNAVGGLREGGRWSESREESGLRWWAGLEAVVVKPERWRGGLCWTGVDSGRAAAG